MQRRAFKRLPSNIEVKFFCSGTDYTGTIINLSENGMFIATKKMCFPFDSQFEIHIPLENEVLSLPVRVSRITKSAEFFDGIGLELKYPPLKYLKLVRNIRSAPAPQPETEH